MKYLILLLFVFYEIIEGKDLPQEIKACSRKDPDLNACFMKNGNLAMDYIAQGDSKYDINTLLPLKWEKLIIIEAPTNPPLKLKLINITVYGVQNMKIIKPNIDLDAKQIQFTLINPSILWKQHFTASVEIENIVHEIEGKGLVDFIDGEFLLTFNYDYYFNNGVKHAKIINHSAEFVSYKLRFDLENLDSDEIIKEYWEEAKQYFLTENVRSKCSATVGSYIENIFKLVPFDFVFTP